jgi:hypothetical protein
VRLYRIFPYLASAAVDEPGGAFYLPPGGKNRADSPTGAYRCLYAGDDPSGAIAEAFGRFTIWDRDVLEANPAAPVLPGSRFALATYELRAGYDLCDLDDARRLVDLSLRPSEVVTRDRKVTQRWAQAIQAAGSHHGLAWWSYYDARWKSVAVWTIQALALLGTPRILKLTDDEVMKAATIIVRQIVAQR